MNYTNEEEEKTGLSNEVRETISSNGGKQMRKKVSKYVMVIVLVAILLEAVFTVALFASNRKQAETIKAQQATIDEQNADAFVAETISAETGIKVLTEDMKMIGELATVEYLYTDAAHFTDSKQIKGFNIPFTKKSVLARWNGTIKAGIDVEKVAISADDDKKVITIQMPKAEILSNEVDDESFETLDEDDGLFNKVTVDDTMEIIGDTKDNMEKRAANAGILEEAEANAKELITQILEADETIRENYKVEFEVIEEE